MIDNYNNQSDTVTSPSRDAFSITPSDTQAVAVLPKAILVGVGGVLTLRAVDSSDDVTIPVNAGQILPIRALYVRAAGTTATDLIGLG